MKSGKQSSSVAFGSVNHFARSPPSALDAARRARRLLQLRQRVVDRVAVRLEVAVPDRLQPRVGRDAEAQADVAAGTDVEARNRAPASGRCVLTSLSRLAQGTSVRWPSGAPLHVRGEGHVRQAEDLRVVAQLRRAEGEEARTACRRWSGSAARCCRARSRPPARRAARRGRSSRRSAARPRRGSGTAASRPRRPG